MKNKFNIKHRGVSLIELMVGIAVGLLTVAVALGALMSSRTASSTIRDSAFIQQQATFIFHNIGQQIRQAGSLRIANSNTGQIANFNEPIGFELKTSKFDPKNNVVGGLKKSQITPYYFFIGYQDYMALLNAAPQGPASSMLRDCLGQQSNGDLITSSYIFTNNTLQCRGSLGSNPQPIASNIAEFSIRYIEQSFSGGTTQMKYTNPASFDGEWERIRGIEVCAVIFGDEPIIHVAGTTYQGCDGTVDYSSLVGTQRNKTHKRYISSYQFRSPSNY